MFCRHVNGTKAVPVREHRGRPNIIEARTADVVVDAMASAAKGNKGRGRSSAITQLRNATGLTHKQVVNAWDRTVHAKGRKEKVLTGLVAGQATTSMRSQISVRQQSRWHRNVNLARAELNKLNVDDGTGIKFADVENHFCGNGDEECLAASMSGGYKIIGAQGSQKHEKEQSTRATCTMVKTIFASGAVGSVFFLMSGKHVPQQHSDDWLISEGAPPGSRYVMHDRCRPTFHGACVHYPHM